MFVFSSNKNSIPKFLRRIKVLENFSDNELRLLSNSLHLRQFDDGEVIFKQNDNGVGFYFIYGGRVDIIVENDQGVSDFSSDNKLNQLNEREFEIFKMIASGKSIKIIATDMNISQKTVANYQTSIKQKLEIDNPIEFYKLAVELNLIKS